MPKPASKKKSTVAAPKQNEAASGVERPVLYPEIIVTKFGKDGQPPLTADEMKVLLGWQELPEDAKEYDLIDALGKKIRLCNNRLGDRIKNRPFDMALAKMWESEILNAHWQFNGETGVIGQTGLCISIQHRGAGLVLAAQEWHKDATRWPAWKTEPAIPFLLVQGVEETDAVINTNDTGKPRGFSDVIYRSDIFAEVPNALRRKASDILKNAVQFLWHRTGAKLSDNAAYLKHKRTHADSTDFLFLHPKLVQCVHHIQGEEGAERNISKWLAVRGSKTGTAAGLCYLMAASKSDAASYRNAEPRSENELDLSLMDEAMKFWVELQAGAACLKPLRDAIVALNTSGNESTAFRLALICKAWPHYVAGETEMDLKLSLSAPDDDGIRHLEVHPTVGGIDMGEDHKTDEADIDDADPTPEEIEEQKQEIKKQNQQKKSGKKKQEPKEGDLVVVSDDDGDWEGTIVETYAGMAGIAAKVKQQNGKVFEANLANCSIKE